MSSRRGPRNGGWPKASRRSDSMVCPMLEPMEPRLLLSAALYPDLPYAVAPALAPALPAEFDAYTPPVDGSVPATTAPAFAEWTRTGGPDDTLVLTGDQFSRYTGSNEGKDTRFLIYGQTRETDGGTGDGLIQRLDGLTAAVTLDDDLPAGSMYLLWASNEDGYGYPIAVNQTETWWIGPEKATRGDTVSVYGRNLSHDGGTTDSWVYIKPTGAQAGLWATVTAVNPYKVDFTVPGSLADGDYEVWVHNGHGGHYGWAGPLTLTVDSGPGWTGAEVSVQGFGAVGDGVTDDAAAINAAVNALRNSGDTLYFPAGTYLVGTGFEPMTNLRWSGDGKDVTIIKLADGFATPPEWDTSSLIYAGSGARNLEFRDMTFDADGHLGGWDLIHLPASEDIRFTNVRMASQGYRAFNFDASRRVFLTNSEIISRETNLGTASQVFIDGCDFYGTNDGGILVRTRGGHEVSITNCTAQDYDNSDPNSGDGWCLGRFFSGDGVYGTLGRFYIGGNTTTDMTPRPSEDVDQNSGEQLMWEDWMPHYQYSGSPVAATADTVTFSDIEQADTTYRLIVVDGKGLGQYRRVASFDEPTKTVTIEGRWNVIPDATSTLVLDVTLEQVVVYDNYLDGKDRAPTSPTHIASSGVQPFSGALDFIADGNTFHQIRNAISLWGNPSLGGNRPVYFGLYANNQIVENRWGVYLFGQAPDKGANFLGTIFRDNTFDQIVYDAFLITSNTGGANPAAWVEMTVIEHNTGANLPYAVTFSGPSGSMANTVIHDNAFSRGTASYSGSRGVQFIGGQSPALRDNTSTNFQTTYSGVLPGAILEAPRRVFERFAAPGGTAHAPLAIWNAGSGPMGWIASDDAAWLTLSAARGVVADERSADDVILTCDTAGLGEGEYTATVTFTADSQTRKTTVIFAVDSRYDGPVAWWAFDETGGTTAHDTSGYGAVNDATLMNGAAFTSGGKSANAAVFDGVDDYADIPDTADINLGTHTKRTISLWFQVDDETISTRKQVLYEEGGTNRGLNLYLYDGFLYFGGWHTEGWPAGTFLSAPIGGLAGQWHHAALVLNAGGETVADDVLLAYLDGLPVAAGPGRSLLQHGGDIAIGRVNEYTKFHTGDSDANGDGFAGRIDEVRVYNRALSGGEIYTWLFNDAPVVAFAAGPDTGEAPLTVLLDASASHDPNGSIIDYAWDFGDEATASGASLSWLTHTYTAAGAYAVTLTVTDDDGVTDTATATVTVFSTQAGLVARWSFDESGGTTAYDTSPEGGVNDADLLNGAAFVTGGQIGSAVLLDGSDDYVDVPDTTDINLGTHAKRTISLWFHVNDETIATRKQVLYEEGGASRGLNLYIFGGSLYFGGWNLEGWESGTYLSVSIAGAAGEWHHAALVLDAGGETMQNDVLRAYLDGSPVGSGPGRSLLAHGGDIGIGRVDDYTHFHTGDSGVNGDGFAGRIDEVRVYNRALIAAEIDHLSGLAPAVSLATPAEGAIVRTDLGATIQAAVSDTDGVTKIEFYADGQKVGEDTTAPYSIPWQPTALGSTSLVAVATYDGSLAVAAPVTVTAAYPGDVDFDGKVDLDDLTILGTFYNLPGGATWSMGDFDGDGDVDLDDLTVLGTFYNTAWTPAPAAPSTGTSLAAIETQMSQPAPATPESPQETGPTGELPAGKRTPDYGVGLLQPAADHQRSAASESVAAVPKAAAPPSGVDLLARPPMAPAHVFTGTLADMPGTVRWAAWQAKANRDGLASGPALFSDLDRELVDVLSPAQVDPPLGG